jgi:hypothetical protein
MFVQSTDAFCNCRVEQRSRKYAAIHIKIIKRLEYEECAGLCYIKVVLRKIKFIGFVRAFS